MQQGSVSASILDKGGKLLKCFHCGENNHLENCLKITNTKKKEIMDVKKKHLKERKTAATEGTKKKTTPGQAHMQTVIDEPEVNEEDNHQDEDDDLTFLFMQKGQEENRMLKEQQARKTLKPSYIYLDSTLPFHQMFWATHMTDVRQVDIALRGK